MTGLEAIYWLIAIICFVAVKIALLNWLDKWLTIQNFIIDLMVVLDTPTIYLKNNWILRFTEKIEYSGIQACAEAKWALTSLLLVALSDCCFLATVCANYTSIIEPVSIGVYTYVVFSHT